MNLGEVEAKPRRGRPPKVKEEPEVIEKMVEAVAVEPEEDVTYLFKSKYRDDRVTLIKPDKVRNPDNSFTTIAGYTAEFERNTWLTKNPKYAQIMRDKIKERKDINPLHIFETTNIDQI